MSKLSIPAGDVAGLFALLEKLRERSRAKTRREHPIIAIRTARLDGIWIHRVFEGEGIESHAPSRIAIGSA